MHGTMLQRRPCTILEEDMIFLFTSCRHVYLCVRGNSQLCLLCVHSLITRLQLKKMSVMYESAHVAITFQLLEISSIATSN